MDEAEGPQDGFLFAGRTLIGVLAFELALDAARWTLSDSAAAKSGLSASEEELTAEWARVRALRSDVIAHMDSWIQEDVDASLMVSSMGVSLRGKLEFAFSDWRRWLDILGPWALAQGLADRRPVDEMSIAPAKVALERLRRPGKVRR